jgi:hypothetical protein
MKKSYFIILATFLLGLGIIACQKESVESLDSTPNINAETLDDYLVFGYIGIGWGCKANVVYMISNEKLYADTSKVFCKNKENYQFSGFQISDNEYNKAKIISQTFPSELSVEGSKTFGCPGCADGGMLFIQRKEKGKVAQTYRIDDAIFRSKNSVSNEPFPTYLYNYAKDFGTLINHLKYK